ncbi:caspase family protein [Proteus terrae]|uniref:caspase family protein n=1 Tax=Proteus terrae TaxID=1574161 RepID=UPI000D68730E|nr:caspase family protein [Proteus terrae]
MAYKKVALVIGNSAYEKKALSNPKNDADDISEKLSSYGFDVIKVTDMTHEKIFEILELFEKKLIGSDVGLFFFAGHGIQVKGKNYLLTINVEIRSEISTERTSISLDEVIELMKNSKVLTKIIILDACRDDPVSKGWYRSTEGLGLASVYAPKGTIIAFGTSPGEVASDGSGRNGAYTEALLENIDTQNCPIETMFKKVRNSLAAKTGGKQTSWEHTSLSGDFFFTLSLSKIITEYSETALADVKFDLSENINSIKIIKGLKSYNWYTQLDTLKLLTIENVSKMHSDNLFVIGRNIYQAACGNCTDAINYINNFETKTQSFESVKQKNILDGILFEIFFDSNSNLRKEIKGGLFNEVFDLNKNKRLSTSFLFIASALNAAKGKFYALPGTGASLQINIESTRVDEGILIRGIYIGGNNVLHPTDDIYLNEDGKPIHNVRMNLSDLQTRFSLQLALPIYLQELIFTIEPSINESILFPYGHTVAPG